MQPRVIKYLTKDQVVDPSFSEVLQQSRQAFLQLQKTNIALRVKGSAAEDKHFQRLLLQTHLYLRPELPSSFVNFHTPAYIVTTDKLFYVDGTVTRVVIDDHSFTTLKNKLGVIDRFLSYEELAALNPHLGARINLAREVTKLQATFEQATVTTGTFHFLTYAAIYQLYTGPIFMPALQQGTLTFKLQNIIQHIAGNADTAVFIAANAFFIGGGFLHEKGTQEECIYRNTQIARYINGVRHQHDGAFNYPHSLYNLGFYAVDVPADTIQLEGRSLKRPGFTAIALAAPDFRDLAIRKVFRDKAQYLATMYATYRMGYELAKQTGKTKVAGTFLGACAFRHNKWLAVAIAYDVACEYAAQGITTEFVDINPHIAFGYEVISRLTLQERKKFINFAGVFASDQNHSYVMLGRILGVSADPIFTQAKVYLRSLGVSCSNLGLELMEPVTTAPQKLRLNFLAGSLALAMLSGGTVGTLIYTVPMLSSFMVPWLFAFGVPMWSAALTLGIMVAMVVGVTSFEIWQGSLVRPISPGKPPDMPLPKLPEAAALARTSQARVTPEVAPRNIC